MRRVACVLITLGLATGAMAQDLAEIVLKEAGSESNYTIGSLKAKKAAVIIFWGNRCAYNSYYIDRIKALHQEYNSRDVEFILVNAYRSELFSEESEEKMVEYLQAQNLSIPYLIDAEQVLKNSLKASRSPEVFVLASRGGQFEVYYSGAIDDSPQSEGDVNHPYLAEAIISLLANEKLTVSQNRPAGCLIR